jgi:nitroimidazol reductase NimA-like FMN-containing flavoprotein (pyridoxamine 5'-phosphate oxidase superfamily)
MVERQPVTELSSDFSGPDAVATDWARGRDALKEAMLYWLTTVRPEGRPHVTPLIGVWADGAMYFCTGPDERKAKNLVRNRHCLLTTGSNGLDGFDVVVEGQAVTCDDEAELRNVADTYEAKYGAHFTAPDGTWFGMGDMIRERKIPLYRVAPDTVFGFGKGDPFSQTRWSFA